jgi:glycosyltransferase involved in cell wall biosynthesis
MSYGNCCVVSDIEECAGVVKDKGVTFKRGDIQALAETLQILCDDSDLPEKYRRQAADYVCDKYCWDDVVRRTLELYN